VLEHGGRLRAAAQQFGTPLPEWVDLSTGINPNAWPVPALDPTCWQRLPEDDDGLEAAAANYYGNNRLLALPGSQAAIQILPALFPPVAVACVAPLYEEHAQAWTRAGHRLRRLPSLPRALAAATPNILLCNPNNPTAATLPRSVLLDAAAQLQRRGGWLIVDEAFGDSAPDNCMAPFAGSEQAPNLIVLRSLGKFFGLAGARVGFIFGAAAKRDRLREALGPWPLSGPARAVARLALADGAWQTQARSRLAGEAARLVELLAPLGDVAACALFATLATPHAGALHEHFAQRALLLRCFAPHGLLRVGLPGSEAAWRRLAESIKEWKPPC
jgi:cobalamin biosynthetic protein CobC